jgi:hypothetical protein
MKTSRDAHLLSYNYKTCNHVIMHKEIILMDGWMDGSWIEGCNKAN